LQLDGVLSNELSQPNSINREGVMLCLKDPGEAAVVCIRHGKAMVHSVDFFARLLMGPVYF